MPDQTPELPDLVCQFLNQKTSHTIVLTLSIWVWQALIVLGRTKMSKSFSFCLFPPFFLFAIQKCQVQCPHCTCPCISYRPFLISKVMTKKEWCNGTAVAGVSILLQADSEFLFWNLSLTLTCHVTAISQVLLQLCLKMQLKLLFLGILWWWWPNISVVAKLTKVEDTFVSLALKIQQKRLLESSCLIFKSHSRNWVKQLWFSVWKKTPKIIIICLIKIKTRMLPIFYKWCQITCF